VTNPPITQADLCRALIAKKAMRTGSFPSELTITEELAQQITAHGLETVIAGRHDGKPITFARAFEVIYGERLTLKRAG
jgi:hypothetical protein